MSGKNNEAPMAATTEASLSTNRDGDIDMTSIAILEAVNTSYVPFNGQQIITAMVAGVAYVAMKPIVENLGMSWTSQHRKLMDDMKKSNHPHMSMVDAKRDGHMTTPSKFNCRDISMVAADGKIRKLLCLPLKKLNGWLFSINPEKVRADIRDKLIQYQEECFTVLHDYWTKGSAVRKPETTVDDRTPLRGIVNRIMGKYGMTYQAVYKLVHKEFGVRHIDELSPKQTAEAVEYLATKAIEGDFLGKEKPALSNTAGSTLSDAEFYDLVCLWSISHFVMRRSVELREVLIELKSPLAEKLSPGGSDIQSFLDKARDALLKGTSDVVYRRGGHLGWRCELQKMEASL